MPTATDSPESQTASATPADASETETFFEGIIDDEPDDDADLGAPSPDAAAANTPPATTDPAAPAQPSDPAPSDAPPSESAPAASVDGRTPYVLNADKQSWDIGGAYLDPEDNLVIPAAARAQVERLMRSGIAHQGSFRQTLDAARTKAYDEGMAAAAEKHPDVIAAREVLLEIEALNKGGRDAWADFYESFDQRQAEWTRKQAEAVLAASRTPRAADPVPPEPVQLGMQDASQYLTEQLPAVLKTDPTLAAIPGDTLPDVVAELARRAPEFFYVVEEDRPEDDLYQGDVVCDFDRVKAALRPYAAIASKSMAAKETAARAQADNAAKLKQAGVPSAAPTKPAAAPADANAVVYPPRTPDEMARFLALPLDERNRIIQSS